MGTKTRVDRTAARLAGSATTGDIGRLYTNKGVVPYSIIISAAAACEVLVPEEGEI